MNNKQALSGSRAPEKKHTGIVIPKKEVTVSQLFGSPAFYVAVTCAEIIFYIYRYGAQAVLKRVVCLSPPYQTCLFCLNSAFLSALALCIHLSLCPPPSSSVYSALASTQFRRPPNSRSTQARWLSEHLVSGPSSGDALPGPHQQPSPSQALQPPTISVGVHLAEYLFCPFLWG